MSYENKAFPHTSGTSYNHYGTRGLEDGVVSGGKLPNTGTDYEAVVYVKGTDFAAGSSYDTRLLLPKGAVIQRTFAEVSEAFDLSDAAEIFVGVNGSEENDTAISIDATDAETEGAVVSETPDGSLVNTLAADTAIGVALSSGATVTDAGHIKVVIKYTKL